MAEFFGDPVPRGGTKVFDFTVKVLGVPKALAGTTAITWYDPLGHAVANGTLTGGGITAAPDAATGHYQARYAVPSDALDGEYSLLLSGTTVDGVAVSKTHIWAVLANATTTAQQVTNGMDTALDDTSVAGIIDEANDWVIGWVESRTGNTPAWAADPLVAPSRLERRALVWASRAIIFARDASAFRKVSQLREGDTVLSFSGNSQKDLDAIWKLADDALSMQYGLRDGFKKPVFNVGRLGRSRIASAIRAEGKLPYEPTGTDIGTGN